MHRIDDMRIDLSEEEYRHVDDLLYDENGRYASGVIGVSSEPYGPFYVCAEREIIAFLVEYLEETQAHE